MRNLGFSVLSDRQAAPLRLQASGAVLMHRLALVLSDADISGFVLADYQVLMHLLALGAF